MSQTAMEDAVAETRKEVGVDGAMPVVPAARKQRSILVYLSIIWLIVLIAAAVFADLLPLASYATPVGKPRMTPQLVPWICCSEPTPSGGRCSRESSTAHVSRW